MSITVSESPAMEHLKTSMLSVLDAIQPDIERLPEPWVTSFKGPLDLLMSSVLALGIIPERRMWALNEKKDYIISLCKYPNFVNYDENYIAAEITEFIGMIILSMGVNGKFLLEGPMSRQFITQTQRLIQPPPVAGKKGVVREGVGVY